MRPCFPSVGCVWRGSRGVSIQCWATERSLGPERTVLVGLHSVLLMVAVVRSHDKLAL
jgi:hypothetical protein